MNIHTTFLVLPVAALLGGCSAYPTTESDFGNSVRHMVLSQRVVTGPLDTSPVETGDGERVNAVLEAYRTDVSRPEEVAQPLIIDVGGAGGTQ